MSLSFGSAAAEALGVGVILSVSDDAGANYVVFSKIEDINPPEPQRDRVEITSHDATNKKKKFLAAFLGQGDPTVDLYYQRGCVAQLDAMINAGTTYRWKISIPDGTTPSTLVFDAFIASGGIRTPLKDCMRERLTLCVVDSSVTWTTGS